MVKRKVLKAVKRSMIRCCVDRRPPPGELVEFARLARREEPSNVIVGVDSLLPRAADGDSAATPIDRMALFTAKKWQNGRTLKIAFMGGTAASRKFVTTAAETLAQHANLKFAFTTNLSESELRVAFNRQAGAWSYIGTDALGIPKDKPTINLGWDDQATATHELCHAIGMIHEHQSPAAGIPWNLAAVYRYYGGSPNFWDKATIDNNVIRKYNQDEITQFTQFDKTSIMLYPIPKEHVTDPAFATSWNSELSDADKGFLSEVYAFPEPEEPDEPDEPDEPIEPGDDKAALVRQYTKDVMAAADTLWYDLDDKTRRLKTALARSK